MPEEVNRVLTDAIAAVHFTHSPEARTHLLAEGVAEASIHAVGNTMIDTLFAMRDRADVRAAPSRHGVEGRRYLLVTLHRPALVDGVLLADAIERLAELAEEIDVVFPIHPRTRAAFDALGMDIPPGLLLLPPLGYLEFLGLMAGAAAVLTDSGGIQEETTALGIPCFTLRDTTPRLLREPRKERDRVPGWDGKAAGRVVDVFEDVSWRTTT
jgi:UDP-N-acetylglucosamine 2-epimerase (non-hydrolysing)